MTFLKHLAIALLGIPFLWIYSAVALLPWYLPFLIGGYFGLPLGILSAGFIWLWAHDRGWSWWENKKYNI